MLLPFSAFSSSAHMINVSASSISTIGGCTSNLYKDVGILEYPEELPSPAFDLTLNDKGQFMEKMSGRMKIPLKHFYFDHDHYVCVSDIWTDGDKDLLLSQSGTREVVTKECYIGRGSANRERTYFTGIFAPRTNSYFGGCRGSLLKIEHEITTKLAMARNYHLVLDTRGMQGLLCTSPYSNKGVRASDGCYATSSSSSFVHEPCSDIIKAAAINAAVEAGSCVRNPLPTDTLCGIRLGGSLSTDEDYNQNPFLRECAEIVSEISDKIEKGSSYESLNMAYLLEWASSKCYSASSAALYGAITAVSSSFVGLCAGAVYGYFRNPWGVNKKPR